MKHIVLACAALCASAAAHATFVLIVPMSMPADKGISLKLTPVKVSVTRSVPFDVSVVAALSVTGDPAAEAIRWRAGTLPSGATLSAAGTLSGTVDTIGVTETTLQVAYGTKTGQSRLTFEVLPLGSQISVSPLSAAWSGRKTTVVPASRSHTFTVTNTGDIPTDVSLVAPSGFSVANNTCTSVAPGATCQITVSLNELTGDVVASKAVDLTGATLNTPQITIASNVLNQVHLEEYAGARRWEDGTYSMRCEDYIRPAAPRTYAGATGYGAYWLKAQTGEPFKALCDMNSDGGGWTLVTKTPRNSITGYLNTPYGSADWLLNDTSNVGADYSASLGFNRWSTLPFTSARITVIAGDNPNHRVNFFKTVTDANLRTWATKGATEPHASVACLNLEMTSGCTSSKFNHTYFGDTNNQVLVMHGVDISKIGVPANMPVHLTWMDINTGGPGVCSATSNSPYWPDSYQDGHWGNALHLWLK